LDLLTLETTKALYPSLEVVLMSAKKLPQTDTAVTGIDSPSSRKRRVIPDFFPIKPMLNLFSFIRG
jgi:hypothetical protein